MGRNSATAAAKIAGSAPVPAGAAISAPPTVSGTSSSAIEMSKDGAVIDMIESCGPKPGTLVKAASRSSSASWLMITPFGRPVEPEV